MRKEIQQLLNGKALGFMSLVSEKLTAQSVAAMSNVQGILGKKLDEAEDLTAKAKSYVKRHGSKQAAIAKLKQENEHEQKYMVDPTDAHSSLASRQHIQNNNKLITIIGSLQEKLTGDQAKLDHDEDGDIDAKDMKDVRKKGANNDHPELDEDNKAMVNYHTKWANDHAKKAKEGDDVHDKAGVAHAYAAQAYAKGSSNAESLSNKARAASKKASPKTAIKEDALDELSKTTLGSYVKKASNNLANIETNKASPESTHSEKEELSHRAFNRRDGIKTAVNKLVKEDALDEGVDMVDYHQKMFNSHRDKIKDHKNMNDPHMKAMVAHAMAGASHKSKHSTAKIDTEVANKATEAAK